MLKLDERLEQLFKERYYREGENCIEDVIRRVAKFAANGDEEWEKKYYDTMMAGDWLPSTPFLMNAGTDTPMCSACFGLDIEDSIDSIFNTLARTANIFKMGGGVGINFSKLRERGAKITTSGGEASGVLSWMRMFDTMINEVKQGGKRRGAMIGILNYNHPEILDFIRCKTNGKQLTNFNISVLVDDEFMRKIDTDECYNLVSPYNNTVVGSVKAREVWDAICQNNWQYAEPGLLFRDAINSKNPFREAQGDVVTCNPCGEIPLYPNGCCALASINLGNMYDENWVNTMYRIEATAKIVYKFLNDCLDLQMYPDEAIKKEVLSKRQIGIGICGLHDYLIKMGVSYGSKEGLYWAKDIMFRINSTAVKCSRCEPHYFPDHNAIPEELRSNYNRANWTVTTIAPTGTGSQILGYVSNGCEPHFSFCYKRKMLMADGSTRDDYIKAPILDYILGDKKNDKELLEEISSNGLYKTALAHGWDNAEIYKAAMDLTPEEHVLMQSSLQQAVGNSISKTVNLPKTATVEDVKSIYKSAWQSGVKGLTIYRDGSLDSQVLTSVNKETTPQNEAENTEAELEYNTITPIRRKTMGVTAGETHCIKTACGTMYVTLNRDTEGNFVEVFVNTSKGGICQANINAVARLISTTLRSGVKIDKIISQLSGIVCPACVKNRDKCDGISCPDAIANTIKTFSKGSKTVDKSQESMYNKCPECGEQLLHEGGCATCIHCGYNKCS